MNTHPTAETEGPGIVPIKRALISVSDKTGIVELAQFLDIHGVKIISTGGTANALRAAGTEVRDVSEYTGFPEMMEGRLKTLHPLVHGGLLYKRNNMEHEQAATEHHILPIDLLVVNLYPFAQTVAKQGTTLEMAIENIDIGGPAMLRAGAKNSEFVAVLSDPSDYPFFRDEFEKTDGGTTLKFRRKLMSRLFDRTLEYDRAIADYLDPIFVE